MPRIARVVVHLSLDRAFDYLVPPELEAEVAAGTPVRVPFGKSEARGYVVGFTDHSAFPNLKAILAVAGKKELIRDRVMDLAKWMADYYAAPIETAVRAVLPAAVRAAGAAPLERLQASLTAAGADPAAAEAIRRRAPKRAAVLDALRAAGGAMFVARLEEAAPGAAAAARALEKAGLVAVRRTASARDPEAGLTRLPTAPLPLMPQQAEALEQVRKAIDGGRPPVVLLYGVTGSGKTEVYLQAIAHALERGKGAIVLVPEISLTPQTVERFRSRFGEGVAVLHSHLSDGERHDEWHRVFEGGARIVVGARSALFAPVRDLGLIVVDEEHEPTYKQEEAPRYHARDVAVMRGKLEGCAVVLGSATPSLESWRNAQSGKYVLARMPHRVDHRAMPTMRIVDMRGEAGPGGRPSVFSKELVTAIGDRLARAEQSILFLNRRGFASSLVCPKCGHVVKCGQCSIAMTYHKRANRLLCHLCGAAEAPPERCPGPDCGDPAIRMAGVGTERIEEILGRLFPKARVARMDSDSMSRKEDYRRVLGDFRTGRIDILVGTQMIAKGLHFPNVTLVGVVHADLTLHMPDFRSGERTYQLLTQVAGRAGRGEIAGEVIVQTFTPFHPAIQAARRMDFDSFSDQELAFRKELSYPPYAHFVCAHLKGPSEGDVAAAARDLAVLLRRRVGGLATVADPAAAPIARIRGQFRFQIAIQTTRILATLPVLREAWKAFPWPKDISGALDVDAVSLL